jgi:hypothetical protein
VTRVSPAPAPVSRRSARRPRSFRGRPRPGGDGGVSPLRPRPPRQPAPPGSAPRATPASPDAVPTRPPRAGPVFPGTTATGRTKAAFSAFAPSSALYMTNVPGASNRRPVSPGPSAAGAAAVRTSATRSATRLPTTCPFAGVRSVSACGALCHPPPASPQHGPGHPDLANPPGGRAWRGFLTAVGFVIESQPLSTSVNGRGVVGSGR